MTATSVPLSKKSRDAKMNDGARNDPWEGLITIAKEQVYAECKELLREFGSKRFDEQDAIMKTAGEGHYAC